MTRDAEAFSDADLTAFLDGSADDASGAALIAALDTDPDLNARMTKLDTSLHILRDAYALDALDAPAMPAALSANLTAHQAANTNTKPRFSVKYIAMPAALAASFALGLYLAPQQQLAPAGWIDQVASYQALYVTQTLSGATQDPAVTQIALQQAQTDLDFDFAEAPQMAGLTFKRAQMLAIDGTPLVQLAYLDDAGIPYALCITRVKDADRPMKTATSHDLAAASWVQDGLGYVLIGGSDGAKISGLAGNLRKVL